MTLVAGVLAILIAGPLVVFTIELLLAMVPAAIFMLAVVAAAIAVGVSKN